MQVYNRDFPEDSATKRNFGDLYMTISDLCSPHGREHRLYLAKEQASAAREIHASMVRAQDAYNLAHGCSDGGPWAERVALYAQELEQAYAIMWRIEALQAATNQPTKWVGK